jgi:glycosyltransferase involved in cell wall biosynthesis
MKILWLSHFIPYPPKGGVLQRGYNLIKELSKYHEIHLAAFNQESLLGPLCSGNIDAGIKEAKIELEKYCSSIKIFNIPSESKLFGKYLLAIKSLFSNKPYTINWLKSGEMEKYIRIKLEEDDFDIVHFDTISLDIFKHLTGNLPSVLDHHNIESHMMKRRSKIENNILKKFYFWQEGVKLEVYEKKHCVNYSANITCSKYDLDRLKEILPNITGHVVNNGVDTTFFKPSGIQLNQNELIFVGTMNWYPNVQAVRFIAYNILPLLEKNNINVKVTIIGVNPPKDLIAFSNSNNNFDVLGYVDDVRPFIERSTLYLCPIMDGGGTKLKILDALSMGKAIIAHPIACEGIDVENNFNIILAETASDFTKCINNLLHNRDLINRLGYQARETAIKKYSYENIGIDMSEYYKKLVN